MALILEVAREKNIILVGPILTRSGYGGTSSLCIEGFEAGEDLFNIFIKPSNMGQTSWIVDDTPERRWIDETIEKN